MCFNGTASYSALDRCDDESALPGFAPEDWLSCFRFPVVLANELSAKPAGVMRADRLDLTRTYPSDALDQLVQDLAYLCQIALAAYERSEHLLTIIRPFLSRATWTDVVAGAQRGKRALPAETRQASILRLDIANFTEIAAGHPLGQVISDLNAYLDTMTQAVYRYHGDVDKYLGDGFLSVFASADDAVQAGCAIQRAATDFNHRHLAQGGLAFPTRIGIASGPISFVSLGARDRQERTVLGMPINLAERLQEQATPGRVWFSQATFEQLRDQAGCYYLGPVKVKGLQEPVVVYEKHSTAIQSSSAPEALAEVARALRS
jgi:class 3 adenylate cyclase